MLRANILVLGKSGAGKSSLLNYIWGDVIAKTGAGRPVTERSTDDEIGIYKSEPLKVDDDLELVVYDSWGMEADKADEWNKIIRKESQARERSSNIEDWFHAVIYCVSAKGARIEDFELEKVVKPLLDEGHAVIFALTKCGVASEIERQKVRDAIEAACPSHGGIIEVESVPVTLRGKKFATQTDGKDALLEAAKGNFVANLANKLRKRYLAKCDDELENWKSRVLFSYDDKASFLVPSAKTLSEVAERANKMLDESLDAVDRWRVERDDQAAKFYQVFGSVMLQKPNLIGERFLSRSSALSLNNIRWGGVDHATSVVMNFLPVINVGYWIFRKELYRDELAKKLTTAKAIIKDQARSGLERRTELDSATQMLARARAKIQEAVQGIDVS